MQIIRSDVLGFCMGVSRAVSMARQAADKAPLQPDRASVFTLGPLIHNPQVQEELEGRGIKVLENGELPPFYSTVIIRAHGIPPQEESLLGEGGVTLLDATCPNVKANQSIARDFSEKGFWVFLAGELSHAEITGIKGYIGNTRCSVAANPPEAEAAAGEVFSFNNEEKTALIAQTTINPNEYRAISESIKKYFPDLVVTNTICNATEERQRALQELCGKVNAVIVIGGRNSANTRQLLTLALKQGKPSWIVESSDNIPPEVRAYEIVGICAGASTPDDLINGIEKALIFPDNIE